MPYIKAKDKFRLADTNNPLTAGELNYTITNLLINYWTSRVSSYQTINDISGAMTEALAEFRRRVIIPYEKEKIKENGDVYD